jgi:CubicO group peptidase (beta-lactamase class C family)
MERHQRRLRKLHTQLSPRPSRTQLSSPSPLLSSSAAAAGWVRRWLGWKEGAKQHHTSLVSSSQQHGGGDEGLPVLPVLPGVDTGPLYACCEEMVANGASPGLCVAVARHGQLLPPRAFGTAGGGGAGSGAGEVAQGLDGGALLRPDSIFLVASVTKPVVATAVVQLIEWGELELDAPVCSLLPGFAATSSAAGGGGNGGDDPLIAARAEVTVRHLLTHTSGLPDAVPENHALRARRAPLSDFRWAGTVRACRRSHHATAITTRPSVPPAAPLKSVSQHTLHRPLNRCLVCATRSPARLGSSSPAR